MQDGQCGWSRRQLGQFQGESKGDKECHIYIYYYMQHILYICTCCLGGLITIYLHATETGCDTSEIRRPVFTVPVLVGRRPSEGRAAFKKCKHIRVKLQLCTGGHTRDLCLGIAGP